MSTLVNNETNRFLTTHIVS